jgi:hypothetical protein
MFWLKRVGWACVFAAMASTAVGAAGDKKAAPAAEKPAAEAAAGDIAQWIKQLDADQFADRQSAGEKLFAAGKPAIPALTEAAAGDSLEVTVRSIDLLQRFMESEEESVRNAAKEGLEKIAKSDKANAAQRAKKVLDPKQDQQPQGPMGGMNIGRVQIQIGGANAKKVSVSEINGVKKIEAEDGDRKINIAKNADESIKMEITEKINGKTATKKFAAKNADDLKKKAPKAYEIYKEYAEGNNAMGGGALKLNFGGGIVPGAMPAMPGLPAQLGKIQGLQGFGPAGAIPGADDLGESLKNWNDSLKTMNADLEPEKLSPDEKKDLKEQIAELKKQLDKLDKRLQKTAEKPEK